MMLSSKWQPQSERSWMFNTSKYRFQAVYSHLRVGGFFCCPKNFFIFFWKTPPQNASPSGNKWRDFFRDPQREVPSLFLDNWIYKSSSTFLVLIVPSEVRQDLSSVRASENPCWEYQAAPDKAMTGTRDNDTSLRSWRSTRQRWNPYEFRKHLNTWWFSAQAFTGSRRGCRGQILRTT